jgi:hypothetical protein
LKTPAEVRNALHYVLHNRRKHRPDTDARYVDPFSSASGEACWYVHEHGSAMIIVEPRTWLGKNAFA